MIALPYVTKRLRLSSQNCVTKPVFALSRVAPASSLHSFHAAYHPHGARGGAFGFLEVRAHRSRASCLRFPQRGIEVLGTAWPTHEIHACYPRGIPAASFTLKASCMPNASAVLNKVSFLLELIHGFSALYTIRLDAAACDEAVTAEEMRGRCGRARVRVHG